MRRLFWVGVGAVGAVAAARKVERTLHRYTPAGVAGRVDAVGEQTTAAVSGAVERFRTARDRRERELVAQLLVTPDGGDPHAVLRRRTRQDDAWDERPPTTAGATAAGARPAGRVDPEDSLYDF